MKKVIKCSSAYDKNIDWLRSDEVNEYVKGCTPREKRLFGKIANSKNIAEYLGAVVDTVDVLNANISDSFSKFLDEALEVLDWE